MPTADLLCLRLAHALLTRGPTRLPLRICPPLGGKSVPRGPSPPPLSCYEYSYSFVRNKAKLCVSPLSTDYLQLLPAPWKDMMRCQGDSEAQFPRTKATALPLDQRGGALGSEAEPHPSLGKHGESPSPFPCLLGDDEFRIEKCLVQRFSSLMGSINISLISNPTEKRSFNSQVHSPARLFLFTLSMPAGC